MKRKAKLLSEPVDHTDSGEPIYKCHWTKQRVKESDMILTPGMMPSVKGQYPAAPGYEKTRREEYILYTDCEQNCNTCCHLERVPHDKTRDGFLRGRCKSTPIITKIDGPDGDIPMIKIGENGEFQFHPDDPMHMECYESRFSS